VHAAKRGARGPERIGRLLASYLRSAGLHEVEEARELAAAWRQSVSRKVFDGTRLLRVRNGVVHVGVSCSALLFELSGFCREEILTRLRSNYAGGYLRDLRFVLDTSDNLETPDGGET
jgi:hypothetical protein